MMGRLFGTDGIRGIVGEDLTYELSKKVGRALGSVLAEESGKRRKILIGTDTRLTSPRICESVSQGIMLSGGDVILVGVCPTPAVAYLVKKRGYDAGVMISASHNPFQYNGIKIFGPDGFKLSDPLEDKIEELVFGSQAGVEVNNYGRCVTDDGAITEYIDYLKSCFGVSLSGLKIAVDCSFGSASVTAQRLFRGLGAECIMLADLPDGININEECGSTHTEKLRWVVKEKRLDAGIAFDGDADRCIAVDGNGREIDGDYILALLAKKFKDEGRLKNGALVGTVMTNLGLVKFCEKNGISFYETKVGDRFVLEKIIECGFSLGGEQSGHIILRDYATTGDGQLTALALLSYIKESGKSLETLAAIMEKYPQFTVNIKADSTDKNALLCDGIIKEMINEAKERIRPFGRIIIRPSGTEALIRIMAEGQNATLTESICNELSEKIASRLLELKSTV